MFSRMLFDAHIKATPLSLLWRLTIVMNVLWRLPKAKTITSQARLRHGSHLPNSYTNAARYTTKAIYHQTMSNQINIHKKEEEEGGIEVPCKESCLSIFCKHSQGSMSLPVHHIAPPVEPPQPSQLTKALALPVSSTPAPAHISLQMVLPLTPLALCCACKCILTIVWRMRVVTASVAWKPNFCGAFWSIPGLMI